MRLQKAWALVSEEAERGMETHADPSELAEALERVEGAVLLAIKNEDERD